MVTSPSRKDNLFWIFLIALANTAIHLCFYNTLGFHRDELLYFSLGQHLSTGYASVPPFIGLMAWCMIHLFGPTLFVARLLPAIFSGIMVFLVAAIVKEFRGGPYARILAAIGILVYPVNLRAFYLFEPVFFDVFFWTLIFYILIRWINTHKERYLLLLGIVAGIAVMNKYSVFFQFFGLIIVFILSSRRELFSKRLFWTGILLAFLIILPNFVWQVSHDFPVVTHMKALRDSQLVHVNRLTFLTDQLFILLTSLFLVLPGIIYLLFSTKMKDWRLLGIACILAFAILMLLRGKSYYTAGIYPLIIAAGACFWENLFHGKSLRLTLPALMLLITLPILPAVLPVQNARSMATGFSWFQKMTGVGSFLRDEKGIYHSLPQDYADMLGWDELAKITAKAYRQVPDKKSCLIYCENYGEAGAIMVLGKKYGLPDPVCFSESFYYWAPRKLEHEIHTLIYINDEPGKDVQALFADFRLIGKISDTLAREYGTSVYLASRPRNSFNAAWEKRVRQVRSPF
ncbi:MAG: glycosyltransferase family 39 protein [Bacteroidetes bacterium]|nr:glycosyltransferase family 39 protein [Bacteroidota bacterium]